MELRHWLQHDHDPQFWSNCVGGTTEDLIIVLLSICRWRTRSMPIGLYIHQSVLPIECILDWRLPPWGMHAWATGKTRTKKMHFSITIAWWFPNLNKLDKNITIVCSFCFSYSRICVPLYWKTARQLLSTLDQLELSLFCEMKSSSAQPFYILQVKTFI